MFCVQVAVITSSKYIGFSIKCFIWKPFLFGVVVCWCKVSGCSVEQFSSIEIKNKHSSEINVYIIMFGKWWWWEVCVCLKWWSNTSHIWYCFLYIGKGLGWLLYITFWYNNVSQDNKMLRSASFGLRQWNKNNLQLSQ